MKNLFLRLCDDGYGNDESFTDRKNRNFYWKDRLPVSLHEFSGNFLGKSRSWGMPYKFKPYPSSYESGLLPITLKLAPPPTGNSLSHFSAEGYAKHLIGNSFSIPVVQMILKPLQKIFENRQYPGYDYKLEWEEGHPQDLEADENPGEPEEAAPEIDQNRQDDETTSDKSFSQDEKDAGDSKSDDDLSKFETEDFKVEQGENTEKPSLENNLASKVTLESDRILQREEV